MGKKLLRCVAFFAHKPAARAMLIIFSQLAQRFRGCCTPLFPEWHNVSFLIGHWTNVNPVKRSFMVSSEEPRREKGSNEPGKRVNSGDEKGNSRRAPAKGNNSEEEEFDAEMDAYGSGEDTGEEEDIELEEEEEIEEEDDVDLDEIDPFTAPGKTGTKGKQKSVMEDFDVEGTDIFERHFDDDDDDDDEPGTRGQSKSAPKSSGEGRRLRLLGKRPADPTSDDPSETKRNDDPASDDPNERPELK